MKELKQGFVLSYIKYQDKGAIVRIFEKENGIKSFFIKNIYLSKNKKKVYLSPMIGINFSVLFLKSDLPLISEISLADFSKDIDYHVVNYAQLALVAEFLSNVLLEQQSEQEIYDVLIAFCQTLFNKNSLVYSLYQIIKFLGYGFSFSDGMFFDVKEGIFTDRETHWTRKETISSILRMIENESFLELKIGRTERTELVDVLMEYCQFHIGEFSVPNSLEIFREIF